MVLCLHIKLKTPPVLHTDGVGHFKDIALRKRSPNERIITAIVCMQHEQSLFTFGAEARAEFIIAVQIDHSSRVHRGFSFLKVLSSRSVFYIIARVGGKIK